jgi:hypothetical protein
MDVAELRGEERVVGGGARRGGALVVLREVLRHHGVRGAGTWVGVRGGVHVNRVDRSCQVLKGGVGGCVLLRGVGACGDWLGI